MRRAVARDRRRHHALRTARAGVAHEHGELVRNLAWVQVAPIRAGPIPYQHVAGGEARERHVGQVAERHRHPAATDNQPIERQSVAGKRRPVERGGAGVTQHHRAEPAIGQRRRDEVHIVIYCGRRPLPAPLGHRHRHRDRPEGFPVRQPHIKIVAGDRYADRLDRHHRVVFDVSDALVDIVEIAVDLGGREIAALAGAPRPIGAIYDCHQVRASRMLRRLWVSSFAARPGRRNTLRLRPPGLSTGQRRRCRGSS